MKETQTGREGILGSGWMELVRMVKKYVHFWLFNLIIDRINWPHELNLLNITSLPRITNCHVEVWERIKNVQVWSLFGHLDFRSH